jgi:hypothetical protein
MKRKRKFKSEKKNKTYLMNRFFFVKQIREVYLDKAFCNEMWFGFTLLKLVQKSGEISRMLENFNMKTTKDWKSSLLLKILRDQVILFPLQYFRNNKHNNKKLRNKESKKENIDKLCLKRLAWILYYTGVKTFQEMTRSFEGWKICKLDQNSDMRKEELES